MLKRLIKRMAKSKQPKPDPDTVVWLINGGKHQFRFPKRDTHSKYDSPDIQFLTVPVEK